MDRPVDTPIGFPTGTAPRGVPTAPTAEQTAADAAFRRIGWRLVPFLQLCFVVASMDRINVSFAKAQLAHDLQLSDAAYGLGAGLFFLGYVLVEVPSNLILHRVGARRWLARIMVSWGIVSAAMALVDSATGFYVLRFCLGVAEAGFAPGVMLYLTQWLPPHRRGRLLAVFLTSLAFSGLVVAPVSGTILRHMDGVAGHAGWQWMFVLESLPAVVLGVAALWLLPDGPADARWLGPRERELVLAELAAARGPEVQTRLLPMLRSARVWWFGLAYAMLGIGVFGITFWLPTLIGAGRSLGPAQLGWISAAPYAAAVVGMLVAGLAADRLPPRRVFAVGVTLGALALAASSLLQADFLLRVLALMAAAAGIFSAVPVFWRACTPTMSGRAAAGGIAVINSIGSFAGFVGPAFVGAARQASGGLALPIVCVAAVALASTVPLGWALRGASPGRNG